MKGKQQRLANDNIDRSYQRVAKATRPDRMDDPTENSGGFGKRRDSLRRRGEFVIDFVAHRGALLAFEPDPITLVVGGND